MTHRLKSVTEKGKMTESYPWDRVGSPGEDNTKEEFLYLSSLSISTSVTSV